MALSELKQTEAELKEYGVQSAPDKLTGSAAENKMIFDRLFQNVGMSKFNLLLDYLLDGTVAEEMGINNIPELAGAETVQAALEALVQAMKDVSAGAVAEGSITTSKVAEAAITGPKVAARAITGPKVELKTIKLENLADDVTPEGLGAAEKPTFTGMAKSDGEKFVAAQAGTDYQTPLKSEDILGMIPDGTIKKKQLASDVTAAALGGAVPSVTKTATLSATGWASNKQTVTVTGITADQKLIITPAPDSYVACGESVVWCTAKATNSLTFQCVDVPTVAVTMNILIVG